MVRYVLQWVLLLTIAFAAIRFGKRDERAVISVYIASATLVLLFAVFAGSWSSYSTVPYHRIVIDAASFAIVIFLVRDTKNWWVLWVASSQLLTMIAHALRLMAVPMSPLVYAVMERWPVWLAICLTGFGVAMQMQRVKRTLTHS